MWDNFSGLSTWKLFAWLYMVSQFEKAHVFRDLFKSQKTNNFVTWSENWENIFKKWWKFSISAPTNCLDPSWLTEIFRLGPEAVSLQEFLVLFLQTLVSGGHPIGQKFFLSVRPKKFCLCVAPAQKSRSELCERRKNEKNGRDAKQKPIRNARRTVRSYHLITRRRLFRN